MLNNINDIYYIKFALQFTDKQIPELVTLFNTQTQNRAWSSMRAYHDQALIDEFLRRGIDASAVYDGKTISPLLYRDSTLTVCSW